MQTVTIYATGECNLRCSHCSVGQDQYEPRPSLSTAEFCETLTRLSESGTRNVTLLGGEATIYRTDLLELLDHADSCGIDVSLNTNGIAKTIVTKLATKPALKSVVVSLDGASAQSHDSVRGRGTFKRSTGTLRALADSKRAQNGEIRVEIAHVISAQNATDSADMIRLAEDLGVHQLSVKHVRIIGRARDHAADLQLSDRALLDAYSSIIIAWLLTRRVQLSVQVPAAYTYYLRERFALDSLSIDTVACAGIAQYGYVDLLGNHLPCPAMSFEEDPTAGVGGRVDELNLTRVSAQSARSLPLFVNFEKQRSTFELRDRMFPCKYCRFSDVSRPCVAEIIQGSNEAEVDICSAVFHEGEKDLPGIRARIFPGYTESPAESSEVPGAVR